VPGYEAYFSTSAANPSIVDFTATIDWGDGTITTATITTQPVVGLYTVEGTHTYLAAGAYATSIDVFDFSDSSHAMAGNTAAVQDAPIFATGVYFNSTVGQPFVGTVATFLDGNVYQGAASYTATINWGDGSAVGFGVITQAGTGSFVVQGTHTFTVAGLKTVTIAIGDSGGASDTATTHTGDRIFANGFN
jgi:hypothetical protein